MKENEPKVKDSQKWWEKKVISLVQHETTGGTGNVFNVNYRIRLLNESYKATYDRLVSIEAKIELLRELDKKGHYYPILHQLEQEKGQLKEKLRL